MPGAVLEQHLRREARLPRDLMHHAVLVIGALGEEEDFLQLRLGGKERRRERAGQRQAEQEDQAEEFHEAA